MSKWKALKWLTYILLTSLVGIAVWFAKDQLSDRPSPKLTYVITVLKTYPVRSAFIISAFLIGCVSLWLLSDRNETWDQLIAVVPLLTRGRKLLPHHLGIVEFRPYYMAHDEAQLALQHPLLQGTPSHPGPPIRRQNSPCIQFGRTAQAPLDS